MYQPLSLLTLHCVLQSVYSGKFTEFVLKYGQMYVMLTHRNNVTKLSLLKKIDTNGYDAPQYLYYIKLHTNYLKINFT